MSNFQQLSVRMRQLANGIVPNATKGVQDITRAIAAPLVYATPIDTSRARLNWQGSIGAPKTGVLAAAPATPATPAEGTQVALESIRAAANAYSGQPGGVFIANNVDYIQKLNNGSSAQAPANFVEQAVMVGVQAAQSVRLIP